MFVRGDGVTLRAMEPSDGEALWRWNHDPEVMHKITLTVVTENHAARRLYRTVGFVDEGRLRQVFRRDGRWYDEYTMGLLAGELR